MGVNLKSLIGKLNNPTRSALEGAAGLCLSRTHYDVEIEHYLMKLLDATDTDFAHLQALRRRQVAARRGTDAQPGQAEIRQRPHAGLQPVAAEDDDGGLDAGLDRLRRGQGAHRLHDPGAGHGRRAARIVREVSKELQKIEAEALKKDFVSIVAGSHEDDVTAEAGEAPAEGAPRPAGGKTPNLDQYTVNLTENAKKGKIDPVLGRDFEIRQIIDILTRRRQNNPILTGEAGVGKTAVVEGLRAAHRAGRRSAAALKNVTLRTLDLALLQAGAGIKGEFENRLKGLIEEVKSSPTPIILFIDEAHTMIGAGGQAGQNDAANLLKPALARGELRTIAATTWSEYKKYFEKDPALARRFQVVKVEEPDREQVHGDAARHRCRAREAPQGPHSGRRRERRRALLASLPAGPPVARQGRERARYRLRPPGAGPELRPARHRRRHPGTGRSRRAGPRARARSAAGADHAERLAEIARPARTRPPRSWPAAGALEKERDLVGKIREVRGNARSRANAGRRPGRPTATRRLPIRKRCARNSTS